MINVMVVDDSRIIRAGLRHIINRFTDMDVVAEADNGEAAVAVGRQAQPNVVLMDVRMPCMDGIQATRQIRGDCPQTQVIGLSAFVDMHEIREMLRAGASGFLTKDTGGFELGEAIRLAFAGKSVLSPELAQLLIAWDTHTPTPFDTIKATLTRRELQVLKGVVTGHTNIEVAQILGITPATVKNHFGSVMSKLGTTSRVQTVAMVMKHHLLDEL